MLGCLLAWLSLCAMEMQARAWWDTPDTAGDSYQYDNLAFNLLKYHRFGFETTDPQWQAPYLNHGLTLERLGASPAAFYPSARRPPLYPVVLSWVYKLFGRGFLVARWTSQVLVALAILCIAFEVVRHSGWLGGLAVWIYAWLDGRLLVYSSSILSESLALLGVTLFAIALSRYQSSRSLRAACAAGVILGLLYLTRTFYVSFFLCPVLIALLNPERQTIRHMACLCAMAALVALPWVARNAIVIGPAHAMGTESGMSLCVSYSEGAVVERGNWSSSTLPAMWDQHLKEHPEDAGIPPSTRMEKVYDNAGRKAAWAWLVENPQRVPSLVVGRVWNHWAHYLRPDAWHLPVILALAVLSMANPGWRHQAGLFWLLLLSSTLFVALTYEDRGRFHVPSTLLIIGMAGAGTSWMGRALASRFHPLLHPGKDMSENTPQNRAP